MKNITRLKVGDPFPPGRPLRYRASTGYIVLRWQIGPDTYVEVLEHRLYGGLDSEQIHHINGIRDDNRPENLKSVTAKEHGREHRSKQVDHAVALYLSGKTMVQAAAESGVKYSATISKALRLRGLSARPIPKRVNPDIAAIVAAYESGEGSHAIAKRLGISKYTVLQRLRESGVPRRPCGRQPGNRYLKLHPRERVW